MARSLLVLAGIESDRTILAIRLPIGWLDALLFSQEPGTIFGPGAGWAGAGLLGLVLSWLLLKHLPDKDRQQREMLGLFMEELRQQRAAVAELGMRFDRALEILTRKDGEP